MSSSRSSLSTPRPRRDFSGPEREGFHLWEGKTIGVFSSRLRAALRRGTLADGGNRGGKLPFQALAPIAIFPRKFACRHDFIRGFFSS